MEKQADLSRVPDEDLYSEIGRRRNAARLVKSGGRSPTCECGKCSKCKKREAMRRYREKGKT
jgi:hypothetical protein